MNAERCLDECKKLAKQLQIELRYIATGNSGLCTIRGKRVFFINRTYDAETQIQAFVRGFKILDLDGYFVVPILRERIERGQNDSD